MIQSSATTEFVNSSVLPEDTAYYYVDGVQDEPASYYVDGFFDEYGTYITE